MSYKLYFCLHSRDLKKHLIFEFIQINLRHIYIYIFQRVFVFDIFTIFNLIENCSITEVSL